MQYLVISLGGILGANARYLLGTWIAQRYGVFDVPPFTTPQELLIALREGKVTGTLTGVGIHVRTWIDMGRKLIRTRVARLRGSAP